MFHVLIVTVSLIFLSFSLQIHLWQLFEEEWKNTEGKQVLSKKLAPFFTLTSFFCLTNSTAPKDIHFNIWLE